MPTNNGNPWKGLNFYVEGEILYGRDVEIQSLSHYILNNTQTILYGRSGIGKSSILNAGIFPEARKEGLVPVTIRFKHDNSKTYLDQIKDFLKTGNIYFEEVAPVVSADNETLWEFIHRHKFFTAEGVRTDGSLINSREVVPLLIFDQFEEIFTLQADENKRKDFFNQLADLFNDVKPLYIVEHETKERERNSETTSKTIDSGGFKGLNISLNLKRSSSADDNPRHGRYLSDPKYHIVFAMREDFLSSIEIYARGIPVMKNNRFALLPINEEQAAEIIMRPRPELVSKPVAKLIIEKVTGRNDFELDGIPEIEVDAAILSLYLSRLYDKMVEEGKEIIDAELVEKYSDNIIESFYEDAIKGLPDDSVHWLEDNLINSEGRRDNRDRSTVLKGTGLTGKELTRLYEEVKLLRLFKYGRDSRIEYIHDVLCPVIVARRNKRDEDARLAEVKAEAEKEKRQSRKQLYRWIAAFVIFIALGSAVVYAYQYGNYQEYSNYYADYELIDGWPKGVGKTLSKEDREKLPIYYKLSRKGLKRWPFTEEIAYEAVELMSNAGDLPSTPRMKMFGLGERSYTDEVAEAFATDLSHIKKLEFKAGSDGQIDRVIAKGDNDSTLFLYTYFHLQPKPNPVMWVNFLNPNGTPKALTGEGIDRVMVSMDSLGRVTQYMYYDQMRVSVPSNDSAYGKKIKFSSNNDTITEILLDQYHTPLESKTWNGKVFIHKGDTITEVYKLFKHDFENPSLGINEIGAWKIEYTSTMKNFYFDKDNPTEATKTRISLDSLYRPVLMRTYEGDNDRIPSMVKIAYSKQGNNIVSIDKYCQDARTYWSSETDTLCSQKFGYIYRDNLKHFDRTYENLKAKSKFNSDKLYNVYLDRKYTDGKKTITEKEYNLKSLIVPYFKEVQEEIGNQKIRNFYSHNDSLINVPFSSDDDRVLLSSIGNPSYMGFRVHSVKKHKEGEDIITNYYIASKASPVSNEWELRPTEDITSKIERFDEMNNRTHIRYFDKNNDIVTSMMFGYENGLMTERMVWGIDDKPVRSYEWEKDNYGYYKLNISGHDSGNMLTFRSLNEFNEESVFFDQCTPEKPYQIPFFINYIMEGKPIITENDSILHIKYKIPEYQGVLRSINVKDYITYYDKADNISDALVAYLHVKRKSSPLYKSGLRDGDRLMAIDGWKYSKHLDGIESAWKSLENGRQPHKLIVLRPQNGKLIKKEFIIPKGATERQELYASHVDFHLTNKEKDTFNKYKAI